MNSRKRNKMNEKDFLAHLIANSDDLEQGSQTQSDLRAA